jgi:hypothetical protein
MPCIQLLEQGTVLGVSPLRSTTEVDYIKSALTTKVNIIVLVLSNDEKSQVVGVSRMNA